MELKFPGNMHINTLCANSLQFRKILCSSSRRVALNNCLLLHVHVHSINGQRSEWNFLQKMEQDYILVLGTNTCIYIFSPIPYGISGNSVQGFKRSCAYKKNDRPETYMYHVQKVCGKITLTLNFKKPANENMGFR